MISSNILYPKLWKVRKILFWHLHIREGKRIRRFGLVFLVCIITVGQYRYVVKFKQVKIRPPSFREADDTIYKLYPNAARLRSLTYAPLFLMKECFSNSSLGILHRFPWKQLSPN